MVNETRLPYYMKVTTVLLGLALAGVLLYYGAIIFVPMSYAVFFAVLLHPMTLFLERRGLPRVLAITLALAVAVALVLAILGFISLQIGQFSQDLPKLKARSVAYLGDVQAFIKATFGVTDQKQIQWFRQGAAKILAGAGLVVTQAVVVFTEVAFTLVLVPIYTFLFLFYKKLFIAFFFQLFSRNDKHQVNAVLTETQLVLKNYLLGLMLETAIVAVFNVSALLLLGIDYALVLGLIAALLNLIPYIGIMIGSLFPLIIAFITKDALWYPVAIVVAFAFIQFVDNNIIVPKVVGSHVRINAVATIIAVILGGQLWGISGMFLFIPFAAILKVIFDRVEPLKPWGLVLGDEIPEETPVRAVKPGVAKKKVEAHGPWTI